MSKIIYKYPLAFKENIESGSFDVQLNLPINSKILDISYQDGIKCLWVFLDKNETKYDCVTVSFYGTGWEIKDHEPWEYFKTLKDQDLIWHFFIKKSSKRSGLITIDNLNIDSNTIGR